MEITTEAYKRDIQDQCVVEPEKVWPEGKWTPRDMKHRKRDGDEDTHLNRKRRQDITSFSDSVHDRFEQHAKHAFQSCYLSGSYPLEMGDDDKETAARRFLMPVASAWAQSFNIPFDIERPNDVLFQLLYWITLDQSEIRRGQHDWQISIMSTAMAEPQLLPSRRSDVVDEARLRLRFINYHDRSRHVVARLDHFIPPDAPRDTDHISDDMVFRFLRQCIGFDVKCDKLVHCSALIHGRPRLTLIDDNNSVGDTTYIACKEGETNVLFFMWRGTGVPSTPTSQNRSVSRPTFADAPARRQRAERSPTMQSNRSIQSGALIQSGTSHIIQNLQASDTDSPADIPVESVERPPMELENVEIGSSHPVPSVAPIEQEAVEMPTPRAEPSHLEHVGADESSGDLGTSEDHQPLHIQETLEREANAASPLPGTSRDFQTDRNFIEVESDSARSQSSEETPLWRDKDSRGNEIELVMEELSDSDDDDEPGSVGLDLAIPDEDAIARRFLSAVRSATVTDHLDGQAWSRFCAIFMRDPADMDTKVGIKCMEISLHIHQGLLVVWAMDQSPTWCGGFIADAQGMGKTISSLAICAVNAELTLMDYTIQQYRKGSRAAKVAHCMPDEAGPCPSQSRWSFACQCTKKSPTANWRPRTGINLVIPIPTVLLSQWYHQSLQVFKKHSVNSVKMEVFMGYTHLKPQEGVTPPRYLDDAIRDEAIKSPLERTFGLFAPQYIIVTSEKCFANHVQRPLSTLVDGNRSDTRVKALNFDYTNFGHIFIDECHQRKNDRVQLVTTILKRPRQSDDRDGGPNLWCLSGTPFHSSVAELNPYLKWLTSRWNDVEEEFAKEGSYGDCSFDSFDKLRKDIRTQFALLRKDTIAGLSVDELNAQLNALLRQMCDRWGNLAIGRTDRSPLPNGKKMCQLPTLIRRKVECPLPGNQLALVNKHYDQVRNTKVQEERNKIINSVHEGKERTAGLPKIDKASTLGFTRTMRLFSNFPFLLSLLLVKPEYNNCDFLNKAIDTGKWHTTNRAQSPFTRYLDDLTRSNGKVAQLRRILDDIVSTHDTAIADPIKRQLARQKLVILSDFTAVVLILQNMIEKEYPALTVDVIGTWVSKEERSIIFEGFRDEFNEDKYEPEFKRERRADVLIGTMKTLGTGTDLPRANHVILWEPWYDSSTVKQAKKRIHRIGQTRISYSYNFITAGSKIEQCVDDVVQQKDWLDSLVQEAQQLAEQDLADTETPGRGGPSTINVREHYLMSDVV